MNYISTRGNSAVVTASQAIRLGIAPDGGLFTAEAIPQFTELELKGFIDKSYQALALEIFIKFLTDFKPSDLKNMVAAAYSYPIKFDDPQITPVKKLSQNQYLLELWHGPTCAFKDVALQLLPHLMIKASQIANDFQEIIILVATSGDTGKAALEGFKDVPGTKIIVFFPDQGVSEIQRLQMVTQEGNNTYVAAVQGNFDDAQNGVKQIFADPAMAAKLQQHRMIFSSANSINWGRLAPQIVYYFYGYCQLCRSQAIQLGDAINITVPTGNFGNILAAYIAKQMGLPIHKLICASNSNNVLTDFIKSGRYDRNRNFYSTVSPSMDILISSNLERLLFYLSGNHGLVNDWMNQLKSNGRYQVDQPTTQKIKEQFYGGYATEDETKTEIRKAFLENQVLIDTHTAVGVSVYNRYQAQTGDNTPVLIASTASPFKFNASVYQAIRGENIQGESEFTLLEKLAQLTGEKIPASLGELSRKEIRHHTVCQKQDMDRVVTQLLGI